MKPKRSPKLGKYYAKWKANMVKCQNVTNTMQYTSFWFQTVANTRHMIPGKKSKGLLSVVEVMPAWKWYILPVVESQKEGDERMMKA